MPLDTSRPMNWKISSPSGDIGGRVEVVKIAENLATDVPPGCLVKLVGYATPFQWLNPDKGVAGPASVTNTVEHWTLICVVRLSHGGVSTTIDRVELDTTCDTTRLKQDFKRAKGVSVITALLYCGDKHFAAWCEEDFANHLQLDSLSPAIAGFIAGKKQ